MSKWKKPTITGMAEYIGRDKTTMYKKKRNSPKEFGLLWAGWVNMCNDLSKKDNQA